MKTVSEKIEALLSRGQSITAIQSLAKFGCLRLAPRIKELRDQGLNIETHRVKLDSGKTIARYKLAR